MRQGKYAALLVAAIAAVAGIAACARLPKPVPLLGVVWGPYQSGWGTSRPSEVFNGGDPTGRITNVTWQSWGSPEAVGHGTSYYVSPTAAVLTGEFEPATIVAWDLGTCLGHRAYLRAAWYFPTKDEKLDRTTSYDICKEAQDYQQPPQGPSASTTSNGAVQPPSDCAFSATYRWVSSCSFWKTQLSLGRLKRWWVRNQPRRSQPQVVLARLGQAQPTVRAAADHIGVRVILAVVFPETDWADVVAAALRQRQMAAARAPIGTSLWTGDHTPRFQPAHVLLEPPSSLLDEFFVRQ